MKLLKILELRNEISSLVCRWIKIISSLVTRLRLVTCDEMILIQLQTRDDISFLNTRIFSNSTFQDTYWATYTCLIGMNKLYLGSKNFLLTTSILESASNITFGLSRDRSRPFRHLKFCLKWFQSSYRAYILCEELKLKFFTPQKNFEIVRPQIRGHSRPP